MKYLFKKNFHLAVIMNRTQVDKKIKNYNKAYPTPKYLSFIKDLIHDDWEVRVYEAGVSKYVFVTKGSHRYKVRFSNHRPNFLKQMEEDSDYYVGVSHKQTNTTEEILNLIQYKYEKDSNLQTKNQMGRTGLGMGGNTQ